MLPPGSLINKMDWLKSSQYVINSPSSPCSMASIFVILNGACFVFAISGNVLEKCCFARKISGILLLIFSMDSVFT